MAGANPPGSGRNLHEALTDVVNYDLNMPRAMSVTWDLVRSDLPEDLKKATIMRFDDMLV